MRVSAAKMVAAFGRYFGVKRELMSSADRHIGIGIVMLVVVQTTEEYIGEGLPQATKCWHCFYRLVFFLSFENRFAMAQLSQICLLAQETPASDCQEVNRD